MKQRLLVMNGQRIVQSEQDGRWQNEKVEKAFEVKPGIYSLYSAVAADKAKEHIGTILHVDKAAVYQQVGREIVKHERADFDKPPDVGHLKSISYKQGRANIGISAVKLGRSLGR